MQFSRQPFTKVGVLVSCGRRAPAQSVRGFPFCRWPHLATLVLLGAPLSHPLALVVVHKHEVTGFKVQSFLSAPEIQFCLTLLTAVAAKLLLFTLVKYFSDLVSTFGRLSAEVLSREMFSKKRGECRLLAWFPASVRALHPLSLLTVFFFNTIACISVTELCDVYSRTVYTATSVHEDSLFSSSGASSSWESS